MHKIAWKDLLVVYFARFLFGYVQTYLYFCSRISARIYTKSAIFESMKNRFLRLLVLLAIAVGEGSVLQLKAQSFEALLDTLDNAIAHYDQYAAQKESRILALRRQLAQKQQPADRYAVQTLLYDEYYVYEADSAMAICNRQLAIAEQLKNDEWKAEWHIKRSFILAATGLLEDADAELSYVEGRSHTLPPAIRTEYYRQKIYIYSHMQQYLGSAAAANPTAQAKNENADVLQQLYNDSILLIVPKTDPLYLWQVAWGPEGPKVKSQLEKAIAEAALDNRFDAMTAYSLAHIYDMEGNQEDRLRALVKSAIADVRCCNHDVASLEELARILFDQGDIDRPYRYINYCLHNDLAFHNRVRIVTTGQTFGEIHQASVERQHRQQKLIIIVLAILVALSVLLAVVILQLILRVRRSHREELALAEANHQQELANAELQSVNRQLQEMVEKFDTANAELSAVNSRLSEAIDELDETNFVKEEAVGMAFTLCSGYISKMEEQRKTMQRLIKVGNTDLLQKQLATSLTSDQLKEFFRHFDQMFLNIYPNFIDDFNTLLRPDERIQPKEGDQLNTELRIYALVRLGVNDSVKIADFLHCSPQTVYNYRLRTRNKSDIPNADFASAVMRLGKANEQIKTSKKL